MILKNMLTLIVLTILLNIHCNSNEPTDGNSPPGRRDYIWTIDTISSGSFQTYLTSIWGSSANDVWLAGDGSPSMLWHFDGSRWSRIKAYDGKTAPTALWGFSSSDIWLGSLNEFWRYNGTSWYKFSDIIAPSGFQYSFIEDIWSKNSFDVWGVGFANQPASSEYKGVVMHFTGSQWQYVNIPDWELSFYQVRQQYSTNFLFIVGRQYATSTAPDLFKVLLLDGITILKEIYSSTKLITISQIEGEVYFSSQEKIYKYSKDKLNLWKDFSGQSGMLMGRSELDFFGFRQGNGVLHYNGTDMQIVYETSLSPWAWSIFEKDVFFAFPDLQNDISIIVHGHLP